MATMNMNDIIVKKRDGETLSSDEIKWFIDEYVKDRIPDYQASALLMAIYFQGLSEEETFHLTDAMRFSGETEDLSEIPGIKVDKHSTGGVGDKMTLIIGPIAAACGIPVAKMSGRGLGFTGGTIDKLASIPGFRTDLTGEEFRSQVKKIGFAVMGQSGSVTPADKKLYALRDVTGTVENYSLIASSVMSKKLAAGSDAIVLDVTCGRGAFMKDQASAETLARLMCEIGNLGGKRTMALISDMSQPMGHAIGNSLEVIEAIETLKGNGPEDVVEMAEHLAGLMVYLGGRAKTAGDGRIMAKQVLASGAALPKLRAMIEAQGGNPQVIDDYDLFPEAAFTGQLKAETGGYICQLDAMSYGLASQHTGAGRERKEDDVDLSAGIIVHKKTGDKVSKGDVIATFYSNSKDKLNKAVTEAADGTLISRERVQAAPLVKGIIE